MMNPMMMMRPGMPGGFPGMMPGGFPGQLPQVPPGGALAGHVAPTMTGEPVAKKARTGNTTLSEADWIAQNPGPVTLSVSIPNDASRGWNFAGQTLSLTFEATSSVKNLKDKLSEALNGMPAAKMKLNLTSGTFLNKDGASLASYNIPSGSSLNLGVRERGGRKK